MVQAIGWRNRADGLSAQHMGTTFNITAILPGLCCGHTHRSGVKRAESRQLAGGGGEQIAAYG